MIRRIGAMGCGLYVLLCCCCADAATPAQVRQAIDKAKAYLYSQQKSDGTWEASFEPHGDQKTGQTALATYALLSSGESHQDSHLVPAIVYLKKTETTGIYALGVRCQVWLNLPPTPEVRAAMAKDAKVLVQSMKRAGESKGFYDYNPGGGKRYSHSRSQYAVLGLWAATQTGIEVPREYWQIVEKGWIEHQDAGGAWNYIFQNDNYPPTPGMTAVGVATLFITQDFLHAAEGLSGTGGNVHNPAIERGMKWMTDNFSKVASEESYKRDYPLSTLYAIERIAVASGTKRFGDVDWYDKGAGYLLKHQRSDGSYSNDIEGTRVAATSLAILFLARGSAPVVMSKLDYSAAGGSGGGADMHWNQRPRDVANVTRWVGRQVERDLNWQVINLDAPAEEFNDAPILYLAGNQALQLSAEHEAKLRQFVERGGLILGNADGASKNFADGFTTLGKKLFPAYAFAPLPENHVIFVNQQFPRTKWKRKPTVLSLSNGARELMILLPDADPAKAWQTQTVAGREELFQLAADIFLYAVDKQNLRRRGESYLILADPKIQPAKTIKLARLQYAGNWDPEPGGWRRLASVMHNADKVALQVEPVALGSGKLGGYKIAHLTGTAAMQLDTSAREELKKFLAAGGTLLVDAAGGSSDFAAAAEAEIAALVPDAATQLKDVIPLADPLYTAGGYKLRPIVYRSFARTKLGLIKTPQLRGVRMNGRLAVIFSREDLSVGLIGQPVDGIVGYDPDTATTLMSRVILFASGSPSP
jgi:hypothetical protein